MFGGMLIWMLFILVPPQGGEERQCKRPGHFSAFIWWVSNENLKNDIFRIMGVATGIVDAKLF